MLSAFNEKVLIQRVGALSVLKQRVFGTLCCERLIPNYIAFQEEAGWGDWKILRDTLDIIWADLEGRRITAAEVQQLTERCESAAPDSEDFNGLLVTAAQDASFAICSLLDHFINPEPHNIVSIATFATDSVDLYVQETESLHPQAVDLEQNILAHPLMQRELECQEQDLLTMSASNDPLADSIGLRNRYKKGNLQG